MLYYSTGQKSPRVDFRQATINGQAPDKGLYFPETIPPLRAELIRNLKNISRDAIAYEVMKPYVGDTVPVSSSSR